MTRWLVPLLVTFVGASCWAQEQPPKLLSDAVHCLVLKKFLPDQALHDSNWGYWVDTHSYPGERVLYAVEYARSNRSTGWIFTIFLSKESNREVFNIQNNARFVRVRKGGEYPGVSFPDPPLGGIWTQGHIASAIRKIELQRSFAISMQAVLASQEPTLCQSYTDKR